MQAKPMRNVGLGLGTLALVGTLWLLLAPHRTIAVRSRDALQSCSGEMNRFQMVLRPPKDTYLLDTCTGDVWTLIRSPDKTEPGAWVIMDRYDTREEVARLLEYLRGEPQYRDTGRQDQSTDQQQYQDQATDQQQDQTTDQRYEGERSQSQETDEQYQDTGQQSPDSGQPEQEDDRQDRGTDQQY